MLIQVDLIGSSAKISLVNYDTFQVINMNAAAVSGVTCKIQLFLNPEDYLAAGQALQTIAQRLIGDGIDGDNT